MCYTLRVLTFHAVVSNYTDSFSSDLGAARRSQKWINALALSLMMIFTMAVTAEGFIHHHHEKTEDQGCSYCKFHKATSQSVISVSPLHIVPLFSIFIAVLIPQQSIRSIQFSSNSGRSPPIV